MTVEMCLSICRSKEYPFAGLQWQCECHCGYEPADGFEWAWSDKCDEPCVGDSNQICGGSNAMSVWTTLPEELYGICVNDYPQNRRVLDEFSITGLTNLTIEHCSSICQGKDLFLEGVTRGVYFFILFLHVVNIAFLSGLQPISFREARIKKNFDHVQYSHNRIQQQSPRINFNRIVISLYFLEKIKKITDILVSKMATLATVEMMIRNLFLFQLRNAINHVLEIKIKFVEGHGVYHFMGLI